MSAVQTPAAPRYDVTLFICQGEQMTPLGRSRDVSESGLFLETAQRPTLGSLITIALVWGEGTFTCQARVARHADEGVGLSFVDPDPAFKGAIAEILETSRPVRGREAPS
ncbi:MAG: PilZ domain-containing protein [Deltaproteobacteria bacterium]|nr:PilZ domain-containing protein [Deltaproteobacteria bacterium]